MPNEIAKALQIDTTAHPGAMVCLCLTPEQQQSLRDTAGLPEAEADHVTLCYLAPDASAITDAKNALIQGLTQIAQTAAPLDGTIGGVARFSASESSDGRDVLVALYDSPCLSDLYAAVCACVCACGIELPTDHGFTPHITLAYLESGAAMPIEQLERLPIGFACLTLIWAGERIDLPFQGGAEVLEDQAAAVLAEVAEDIAEAQALLETAGGAEEVMGGPVKSLSGGRVGGYLVRFSSESDPDLTGDFFTKETDFGIQSGAKTYVWFNHRKSFKARDGRKIRVADPIGEGTMTIDSDGVFVDAVLYNRKRYEDLLDALGWSSGTAAHLIDREPRGKKAMWIKRWPLGLDASLTFEPAEPRNGAVALRSLHEQVDALMARAMKVAADRGVPLEHMGQAGV